MKIGHDLQRFQEHRRFCIVIAVLSFSRKIHKNEIRGEYLSHRGIRDYGYYGPCWKHPGGSSDSFKQVHENAYEYAFA